MAASESKRYHDVRFGYRKVKFTIKIIIHMNNNTRMNNVTCLITSFLETLTSGYAFYFVAYKFLRMIWQMSDHEL